MRIQFNENDPRRGMVAEVDDELAKQHIANKAASKVSLGTEGRQADQSAEQVAVIKAAQSPKAPKPERKAAAKTKAK